MELISSILISIAALVGGFFAGHSDTSEMVRSVEFNLTELSPLGADGGLAMPASGGSAPTACSVSMSPSVIDLGETATITYSASGETTWYIEGCDDTGTNCTTIYNHSGGDYSQDALASGLSEGLYVYRANPGLYTYTSGSYCESDGGKGEICTSWSHYHTNYTSCTTELFIGTPSYSNSNCTIGFDDSSIFVGEDTNVNYTSDWGEDSWTLSVCDLDGSNCTQLYSQGGGNKSVSASSTGLAQGQYRYQAYVVDNYTIPQTCYYECNCDKWGCGWCSYSCPQSASRNETCFDTLTVQNYTPPTCTLTVDLGRVVEGEDVVLEWDVSEGEYAPTNTTIDQGVGVVSNTDGQQTVTIVGSYDREFTMTVTNDSDSAQCVAQIQEVGGGVGGSATLVDVVQPPTATLQVCDVGGANCETSKIIDPGDDVELQWSSTDAASCTFGNFDGDDGDGDPTTGGDDATITEPTNDPVDYTVNCDGATDSVTVSLSATAPEITADGLGTTRVVRGDTDIEICWDTNADPSGCTLSGPEIAGTPSATTSCQTVAVQNTATFGVSCPFFPADEVMVRVVPKVIEN